MKRFLFVLLIAFLAVQAWGAIQVPITPIMNTAKAVRAIESQKVNTVNVKTWKMPPYMIENLRYMRDAFNRAFDAQLEGFKKELKTRYSEFADMPSDAIFDFESGVFIGRNDYIRLLQEAQKEQGEKRK